MTRPPFSEFSSIAIERLTEWAAPHAVWSQRLREVLTEHFLPAAEELGLDAEKAWEALGASVGPVYGMALEDLCTRQYEDPLRNVVDDFLRKRGFRLPPLAKAYLEALRDSVPGIYEAVAVQPGHGVTVRDLIIGGNPIEVIEVSGSRQIVQWDRLAARVVEHGGVRVFTGGLFPLATDHGMRLMDALKVMVHTLAAEAGVPAEAFQADARGAMRAAAPLIANVNVVQILSRTHRRLPKLLNREGDPHEAVEAHYPLVPGRSKQVVARLESVPGLQRTGARPPTWDWVGKASEYPARSPSDEDGLMLDTHPDGDTSRVVLANLTLSREALELSVNSRARLERTRAFIEPLLAGLIGEPEFAIKSVENALAENRHAPASPRRSVPKRVEREVSQRYLDSHYRGWLDEKIPALGGKTPREAARDFEGREQLVALLKELENREARRAKNTGVGYDALWLWRELGIEHLRH